VRGGNYFFLADSAAIETVFDDEFDYIVNPLAYDFEVELEAASGLEFDTAYGAPLDQPGPGIDFGASSLFLSSRGGGIGITLRSASLDELPAEGPRELGTFGVSYLPVGADEPVETELTVFWSGGAVIAEQQTAADALGVYKMAALLDEYLALLAAARYCQGAVDQAQALADIAAAGARLQEVATHLGDAPLAAEADLLDGLATAVLGGTANCWNGYY